ADVRLDHVSSQPVLDQIAKDNALIAKVIENYGAFNETNLRLYLQIEAEEHQTFSKAMGETAPALEQLTAKSLLIDAIAQNAYTTAPIDPTEMPGLKVTLTGEPTSLVHGSTFDRGILEVLKEEGAFSEPAFYRQLAAKEQKIDPFDPETQRKARQVDLMDYLNRKGAGTDLIDKAKGKPSNAVDWVMTFENKSFAEAVRALVTKPIAHPRETLRQLGWSDNQMRAAFKKRMNRLIRLPDKTGLRYHIPDLDTLKKKVSRGIAIPLERKKPLPIDHPFSQLNLKKDLGIDTQALGVGDRLTLRQTHLDFMAQLGNLGVADQAHWQQHVEAGLEKAAYLDALAHGDLPHFEADFLNMAQTRNAGLGKLVKAGLVDRESFDIETKGNTFRKHVYHLTQKGARLLEMLDKPKPVCTGTFKKKKSELYHDLLVHKVFLNETRRAFLEGKQVTFYKSDATFEKALASERETLVNRMRHATGFTKADRMRLNALNRKKKESDLTGDEVREWAALEQASLKEYGPREARKLEHLSRLRAGRSLHELEPEYQRLKKLRDLVENKAPGVLARYKEIQRAAIPDLHMEFQEETGETDIDGNPKIQITRNDYEIDSGAGRGGSGGYSVREIQDKHQANAHLIFATPGGLGSSQGQKIFRLTKARVISI
nr:replication-relaxation family protein [Acidobacteriota bacterium]